MPERRLNRILASVIVLLLAAAACGGEDPSPPVAVPAPAPAPSATAGPPAEPPVEPPASPPPAVQSPPPAEPVAEDVAEEVIAEVDQEVVEETVAGPAETPAAPESVEAVDVTPPTSETPQPPAPADPYVAPADPDAVPADPDAADAGGAPGVDPVDPTGRWEGGISIQGSTDLPFAVDLTASGDGLAGTIDIQGNFGLPLSNVVLDAGRLHFELESPLGLAVWDGEVGDGVIEGEFTQAGMAETFWMQRFEDPSEDAGASFRRTEVVFANGDITLAGELTLPNGDGPHPAVVLISGSGEQDRDSNLGGFRLFAVLANHLAGAGVASLRFDDRGVGGSGGDNLQATLQDRVGDVQAALDVLRSRDDIAAGGIGLVGHSEGAIVAPVVANRTSVAFVGLLAAPVLPLRETVEAQQLELLEQSGATATEVEQFQAFQELAFSAVATGQGWDEVEATFRALIHQQLEAMPSQTREAIPDEEAMVDSIVAEELAAWQSPWFGSFLGYDPRPAIVALEVPVLALFGELDTVVPAPANSIAMSEAIATSSIPGYTIATILSANHLFQEAVTGSVNEYARLKREFAPDFVAVLLEWFAEFLASG